MPIPRTVRRGPQLTSQAQINAVLRYAPERQALAQAVQEARSTHESDIAGAQSEARLNGAAISGAVPAVQGIYDRAAQTSSTARSTLAATLAGLGGSAAPFAAAAASEGAVGAEKTAREGAAAQTQLAAQALAAHAAPTFARTLADNRLGTTLSKILASQEGVGQQEAAATGSEIEREAKERQSRRLTERGQNITQQSDTEGHALTAAGQAQSAHQHAEDLQYKREHPSGSAAGPTIGGVKQLPQKEQNKAASEIARIRELAEVGLKAGHEPGQVRERLTKGTPSVTVEGVKTRGQTPYQPSPLLDAGLEWARYGSISQGRVKQLHAHGYSVKSLGAPVAPKNAANEVARHLKANLGF